MVNFQAQLALALVRYAGDRLCIEAGKEAINSVAITFKPDPSLENNKPYGFIPRKRQHGAVLRL
jgi:hypothetical protein